MTAHVYLPGDRAIYRTEPAAPGQPVRVICSHASGRIYIRIAGVGDLLVEPGQLTPQEPAGAPLPPASGTDAS